ISLFQTACHREPLIIGKPNHYMVDEAMDRFGISKEEMVIVGDRLYTDIRTGLRSGVTTIAVLSGETTKDMLENTQDIPDYVFPSVKEIFEHIKK
ncbi:HAD hydrolase-like protein, partial [Fusobacterium necrophorum]|nr:HAD hydrolase-like protein [Fusobacterium necrophorum]